MTQELPKINMNIDYIATKRNVKKIIDNYRHCLLRVWKVRQPVKRPDFTIKVPFAEEKNDNQERNCLIEYVTSFNQVFNGITQRKRTAFYYRYFLGYSNTKISFEMNYSEVHIRNLLKEAILEVATLLNVLQLKNEF